MTLEYLANIAIGYLLGSIPFGLLAGYAFIGKDIRRFGSGKTGTTNVLRTAGKFAAALVVIGDISKGTAPALIGRFVFHDDGVGAAGAAAGIAGHVWPVFARFRGGRGVATAFGGVIGLTPLVALAFPLIGAILIGSTRYVSVMSIIGTPIAVAILVVLAATGAESWAFAFFGVFAVALIEYMHIPNIRRLLAGTEPKIGKGGEKPVSG